MTTAASRTAEYMALFRALESVRPPTLRLFSDPFAPRFLRPSLRVAVRLARLPACGALVARYADRRIPGARTSAIARTRLIDDLVAQFVRPDDQVVILGAGFDCRAYRLPALRTATVYEVDHPATQAIKFARLALPDLPPNVRLVAADFNRQSLADVLRATDFDPSRRALFLWEGVTNYLAADAVDAVLRFVAAGAGGSHIVFTYVHRGALDGSIEFPDAAALMRDVARLGEPWTFGLHPPEVPEYLRQRGLRLEQDEGARDYRRRCFGSAAEGMMGYDFYHVATAGVPARAGAAAALAG